MKLRWKRYITRGYFGRMMGPWQINWPVIRLSHGEYKTRHYNTDPRPDPTRPGRHWPDKHGIYTSHRMLNSATLQSSVGINSHGTNERKAGEQRVYTVTGSLKRNKNVCPLNGVGQHVTPQQHVKPKGRQRTITHPQSVNPTGLKAWNGGKWWTT